MRILVIDDEPRVAELIHDTLESAGHRCLVARDADEADSMLAGGEVDGITVDLRMPGRDGLVWLEHLAGTRPDLARRCVLLTGSYLQPKECRRLQDCGATLLFKPFSLDRLLEVFEGLARDPVGEPS